MRDQAISDEKPSASEILCTTATAIALDNNVDMFLTITNTGKIARALARQRPMQTILACSPLSNVVHQVNSSRGVIGYKVPVHIKPHTEGLISLVLRVAQEQGFCLPGNKVMIFTPEDEGAPFETVSFKMIEVDQA